MGRRNGHLALARKGMHPAFDIKTRQYRCPLCPTTSARESDYNRHFLAHNPQAETAYLMLSAPVWDREAPRRGWEPPTAQAISAPLDD